MSKSSLIAVLALIASASAKPYIYNYGPLSYTAPRTAYTDFYNSAVAPLTAYSSYPAAYSTAYSTTYPASYSTALSGAYSAPLTLPSFYGSSYAVEELASLVNAGPVASVPPVASVASLVYGSPYSYLYKR
ncbi:uncharacterized protein LOC111359045 [Spodoptera litura]|uniref:Uncharacterized protein LOC111359045 n=1 Tax=Spodoptera litura TaxID=69820 RepID=A0A9J7EKB2_SPOLT|nr:uncharacterized protein LOC111359045 [Spodoptera litura]